LETTKRLSGKPFDVGIKFANILRQCCIVLTECCFCAIEADHAFAALFHTLQHDADTFNRCVAAQPAAGDHAAWQRAQGIGQSIDRIDQAAAQ